MGDNEGSKESSGNVLIEGGLGNLTYFRGSRSGQVEKVGNSTPGHSSHKFGCQCGIEGRFLQGRLTKPA